MVFSHIVWPVAERFSPQLVLVSIGMDAYWADPLAEMRLTLTGYAHLAAEVIAMAQRFCDGKVVFALEGGYNLDALRFGVSNVARALLGEAPIDPLGPPPGSGSGFEPDVDQLVQRLALIHEL
jgi:acetoin utilization deacetylase AcuC-like enzyme